MLTTKIKYSIKYDYLNDLFRKAFDYLHTVDLESLEPGRYMIDGERVFVHIQHYQTVNLEEVDFETHDKHFDIQYMISGTEAFGYINREKLDVKLPYDDKKDITFYYEPAYSGSVILEKGDFITVAPEDGHKPRCQVGEQPCNVKKAVIKIKMND